MRGSALCTTRAGASASGKVTHIEELRFLLWKTIARRAPRFGAHVTHASRNRALLASASGRVRSQTHRQLGPEVAGPARDEHVERHVHAPPPAEPQFAPRSGSSFGHSRQSTRPMKSSTGERRDVSSRIVSRACGSSATLHPRCPCPARPACTRASDDLPMQPRLFFVGLHVPHSGYGSVIDNTVTSTSTNGVSTMNTRNV